ncbi:MAG: hypothetical protein ACKORL_06475, partial [Phycisphaerales bacterium]
MALAAGCLAAAVGIAGGWAAPLPQAGPVDGVRASLRTGDFAAAEQAARRWAGAEPANLRATFYVGLALHKQKRHAEALTFLERADAAHGRCSQRRLPGRRGDARQRRLLRGAGRGGLRGLPLPVEHARELRPRLVVVGP